MVMTMIEKKDPDQKIVENDFSDDDPIIELTDEVIIKPEENAKSSLQNDPFTEPDGQIADDDNRIGLTDKSKLESPGDDDVFIMDNGQDKMDGDSTGMINDDALEMTGGKTRYNLDEEIELEYESDGDEIDFFAEDDEKTGDNDVIAIPSEASPTFGEDDNGIDILADIELEREEGQEFIASDENLNGTDEIIALQEGETPEFEHNGDLSELTDESLAIFNAAADLESEDEIIPLAELDNDDVETDDDIIEITEFDQHFPDDDEEALKQATLLDPSGLEDEDFRELFDIEEEGPMEDEEMRDLSESEEKAVEAELSRFFDDALVDEAGIENKAPQSVEKFFEPDTDLDLAMTAAALSSGTGNIDHSDTPFPQDPTKEKEAASLAKDQSGENEHMPKDSAASKAGDSPVVSPEQIDQAIERIINEKLAGRIEHIIYEIIEKAVKREIDRLKESLLEDSTPEDNI
jgi:hypothetical protein